MPRCVSASRRRGKGRGKGLGPHIPEADIEQVIRLAGDCAPQDVVVVVDSRPFSDPGAHDRYHVGLQPQKVVDIVRHSNFERVLQKTADQLQFVVVYCRKEGVHRSVAFAYLLRAILQAERSQHLDLLETFHASALVLWPREYCGECKQCRQPSTQRDQAVDDARRVWRKVSRFTD